MARTTEVTRTTRGALSGDEAEELFTAVDETGHTNEERARKQHLRSREVGTSVEVDPLAGEDPSGADTDRVITRTAAIFVTVSLLAVVLLQVGWGYVRRVTTSTLAEDAGMRSVVSALTMVSAFGAFDAVKPEYLTNIAFGSEVFPIRQFNIWRQTLPEARFTNLYGPTEATGMCCYYRVDREFGPGDVIPIGGPFRN
ncbi:MAG: hypothetical protein II128_02060, partial [Atopobiaceae bacterium]|nr:hypothetical protein [Atopobiaceae bacterium]